MKKMDFSIIITNTRYYIAMMFDIILSPDHQHK